MRGVDHNTAVFESLDAGDAMGFVLNQAITEQHSVATYGDDRHHYKYYGEGCGVFGYFLV